MSHPVTPFTIKAVSEAIESLPAAKSSDEINSRYHWLTRAIEVEYLVDSGREDLAEQLREFYAGRFDADLGPALRQLETARQAKCDELVEEAYKLNRIADRFAEEPEFLKSFARDLGRDRLANGRLKGVIKRTGRTR